TVGSVADNTAFALFTAEIGDVQIPAGSQYIVELNTPSRVLGLGGDGGLLSFGTNTLGQSGSTYMRGPECGLNDFVDVASVGFGNRHLVMSLGFDNGIAPTIQGGFPMSAIGDAVMSQLGDDLVIAGDPNGSGFGVAIDYGTASSGVGATFGLLTDDVVAGATLSVDFVGEDQVSSIQFSDYLGDPTVAVLDVDFANSELDIFNLYVYKEGELVGLYEDLSSGSVRIRNTGNIQNTGGMWWMINLCESSVESINDCFNGDFYGDSCYFWREKIGVKMPPASCFYASAWDFEIDLGKFEVEANGDEFHLESTDISEENNYSGVTLEINVEGVSGITVDVAGNSPSVAIGDAFSAPYYNEFGEILTAQVGVSFSLYGTDSDVLLTGEDVDGDGLADLTVASLSGPFGVDMMLDGVESASVAFDTLSGDWPSYPFFFCPFGLPVSDGKVGTTSNPLGILDTSPWGVGQWSVNPDFTGMEYESVAYEFFLDGVSVGTTFDAQGILGGTSEVATRAGTLTGDEYGFVTYYPVGTTFTTTDGDVFGMDSIEMVAVGSIPPASLSYIRMGIGDEDASDVRVSFSLPETTFVDFNFCPADLNGDGLLNFFDVSAFLQGFGNQDPASDFNGDGDFNFLDVSAFLQAFGAGCP
ncbi:MAG: hypothetical protein L3J79_08415, partial [Candidatus Marinimicrobia bacterium]|nr:hypothetical protein [Candidatus Neomarinimicrobiota bacterium]